MILPLRKSGDTITVMYLKHGRKAPKGAVLIRLQNHHGAHASIAILPPTDDDVRGGKPVPNARSGGGA